MKKFELTNEGIRHFGKTLYRIKALKDFNDVRKGDLGGFVEKEENLSQEGNCWIYNNALALDNVRIFGNALIFDNVVIFNNVRIFGNALIYDNAIISDNVRIFGKALIFNNVKISDDVRIFANVRIYDNVKISDNVEISDNVVIYDNVRIHGNTKIYGNAKIFGNALIKSNEDWISIDSIGSEFGTLIAYKLANGDIGVTRGCFKGTLEEFTKRVNEVHKDNKFGKKYQLIIELIKLHLSD